MTQGRKRFQTGREIMEAYVPGYPAEPSSFGDERALGARSGEQLAQALLRDLRARLGAKRVRSTPNGRA